jgi:23S rRNA (cytidine2498-2'-O)-methyltransferase
LKLEEAWHHFLSPRDQEKYLQPGMRGVDLGAAPGGWTWQLVKRHIHVYAVDNGPMNEDLMESGLVDHIREDGFLYWPQKSVDWLVCDMVEKPIRVAHLMAKWLATGKAKHIVFNLKLPMKKRYPELQKCFAAIDESMEGQAYRLNTKQLYHDREEVTCYLRLVD